MININRHHRHPHIQPASRVTVTTITISILCTQRAVDRLRYGYVLSPLRYCIIILLIIQLSNNYNVDIYY